MSSEFDEQMAEVMARLDNIKQRQDKLLESIRSNFIPDPTNAIDVEFKVIGDTPEGQEPGQTLENPTSETTNL